jgi:uncharacterized SAM-binding protein YcdF (DUF218 family)
MNYDSIIVHGNAGKIAKSRLDTALDLYDQNRTRMILTGRNCARYMMDYVLKKGVPKSDILLEEKANETLGDIFFTKIDYLEPEDWRRNILVSSDWHLPRISTAVDKIMGEDYYTKLVGSDDRLTAEELEENKKSERFKQHIDDLILLGIKSGNDKAIRRRLSMFYRFFDIMT